MTRKITPLDRYIEQSGITDKSAIKDIRKFAALQHSRYHYLVAQPQDLPKGIEAAVVVCEVKKYSPPEYRTAVKYNDGRIALITAVKIGTSQNYPTAKNFNKDALILLRESYGQNFTRLFKSAVQTEGKGGMIFPAKIADYSSITGYILPAALDWMTGTLDMRPGKKPMGLFKLTLESALSTNAWNDQERFEGVVTHVADYDGLKLAITRMERARFHEAQSAFMMHLDPDILATCKKGGMMTMGAYNWLAGGGDDEKKAYRMQAANAYSLFMINLMEHTITQAIDNGEELKPLLANILGQRYDSYSGFCKPGLPLKEATVNRLQRNFNPRSDYPILPFAQQTWPAMDSLPHEWWPKTHEDKVAFKQVYAAIRCYITNVGGDEQALLRDCKGAWQKSLEFMGKGRDKYSGEKFPRIEDSKDYALRLYRVLYLPILMQTANEIGINANASWLQYAQTVKGKQLHAELFAGQTMKSVLELSERWHERLQTVNARTDELKVEDKAMISGGLMWEALTPPQTAPNGIRIIPLTTSQELKEEGKTMNNCIGGYSSTCHTGDNFIFSLVSQDGKRLSSLCLSGQNGNLTNREHRGYSNSEPPHEAALAAKWYLDEIASNRLKPDWETIHRTKKAAKAGIDQSSIVEAIGFDPHNREKCARAFEIYKPFLPAPFRHIDYATFLAKTDAVATVKAYLQEMTALQNKAEKKKALAR